MKKLNILNKLNELYLKNENIIQYLKNLDDRDFNTIEDILISYDFQAGSYIKNFYENMEIKNEYCSFIANEISKLGYFDSILEVGVGEATTLVKLLSFLKSNPNQILGFDLSWSRLKFAKSFLKEFNFDAVKLFTANLFEIPLLDNSIDIVYTSHSIEPNGGEEEFALKELYRITNKYLILLEPSYELANEQAKIRMKQHGYITNLYSTIKKLDYKIIEYRLLDFSVNPLNPTALIILEKNNTSLKNEVDLVCPISKTKLEKYDQIMYSDKSFLSYPIIQDIPCLLKENAILTSHFLTDYKDIKTIASVNANAK